jgi:hypothetical protein
MGELLPIKKKRQSAFLALPLSFIVGYPEGLPSGEYIVKN